MSEKERRQYNEEVREALEAARQEAEAYLMTELQKERWPGCVEAVVREAGFRDKGDVEAELARARVKTGRLFRVASTLKEDHAEDGQDRGEEDQAEGAEDQAEGAEEELSPEYWEGFKGREARDRQEGQEVGLAQFNLLQRGKYPPPGEEDQAA